MKPLKPVLLFLSIILSIPAIAQNLLPDSNKEIIIESIFENRETEIRAVSLIEDLEYFSENRININAATTTELSKLHLLNDIQIQKILTYINEFGPVLSIYELNSIDGITSDVLKKLEPFIKFGEPEKLTEKSLDFLHHCNHQLLLRSMGTFQKPKGYITEDDKAAHYEGNRFRYYSQYRLKADDILSAGLTAEKDPGEAFLKGSNKGGFDFYSGHISMKINSVMKNITIGDFVVRSGQGLVLWQGYSTGKSLNTLEIFKTNQGPRPYTSVDENSFFRGISTLMELNKFQVNIFCSRLKTDANLESYETGEDYITGLQNSGYHRTENEIFDENAISNKVFGVVVNHRMENLKTGITLLRHQFGMDIIPQKQLYNQYRFRGNANTTGSVDYIFNKGKYQLFGEVAISQSGGKAFLQGAVARLHDQLGLSLLVRHIEKDYHSFYANSFSEGQTVNNRSGIYMGTKILPVRFITLSLYSDLYKSHWPDYSTAAPASGKEFFSQASVRFSKIAEFYIRYSNKQKEQKTKREEKYINLTEKTQRIRLNLDYMPAGQIKLKTRLEYTSRSFEKNEKGIVCFQDINYKPGKIPLSMTFRIAYFSTDSYNSRIYAYENDLLYTFSIPAYYGKGYRTYLNLKYKISQKLDFWMKISNTCWSDRDTISSGYNEIAGNNKTELKLQLRLKI